MTPDTAARVLTAGAGLKVKPMTADTMVRLASIAKERKVKFEIKGTLTPDTMVRIAEAGGGYLFFDASE